MDKVIIRDLEVSAHIGVTEEERSRPQRLLVSVEMELDLRQAGRTDAVGSTVDYARVAETVRQIAHERARQLIEALAEEIAGAVLTQMLAQTVTVEVKKFSVPQSAHAAVQITRSRAF
jgi:dihydroneopterin aldolase